MISQAAFLSSGHLQHPLQVLTYNINMEYCRNVKMMRVTYANLNISQLKNIRLLVIQITLIPVLYVHVPSTLWYFTLLFHPFSEGHIADALLTPPHTV